MDTSCEDTERDQSTWAADDRPSPHDLLNQATVWLQYSHSLTATLADLIHEAEEVNCKQLALSLEAIAAITLLGSRQLNEAHAQAHWDAASCVACSR
jgi:hypothetical protein